MSWGARHTGTAVVGGRAATVVCKSGWSLRSGYPCCAANSQLALTLNSDCAWRAAIQRSGGIAESDPALTRL